MSTFFFYNIPNYWMKNFRPVRSATDNLQNIISLVEIANTFYGHISQEHQDDFDIAVFSTPYRRALVRKSNGHFSMGIPFQVIDEGDHISFNMDSTREPVDGFALAVLRNAASTWERHPSVDDITLAISEDFGLDVGAASKYCDAFFKILSEDHGYFRFDDDPANANGDIHPRFHYDFFFLNSTSVKIGTDRTESIDCFYSMCDPTLAKRYLRQ